MGNLIMFGGNSKQKPAPTLPGQALGSAPAAPVKKSKKEVGYQDPDAVCSDCRYYEGGECSQVEGEIDPEGWCHLFEDAGYGDEQEDGEGAEREIGA
jgi:hypothetical protein